MDLLQLQYFRVVAAHEHMRKAAEQLHISQPTLSKSISRLESDLGVELFDRYGRTITLNDFGKAFLHRVDRVFLELSDGKREIADLKNHQIRGISVALNIPSLLAPLLQGFLTQYPLVSIRTEMGSTSSLRRRLETGDVDFSISSPPLSSPNVEHRNLMTEEIDLIVPHEHRLAHRSAVDLRELWSENFIMFKKDFGIRDLTVSLCRQAGFEPRISFEGDITSSLKNLVNIGLGVALVPAPHPWMTPDPNPPVYVKIANPICRRSIGISSLKGHSLTPPARKFKQYVVERFAVYASSTLQCVSA